MKEKAIYPKINIEVIYHTENKSLVRLETYLRKLYRRKYYLWRFCKETELGNDIFSPNDLLTILVKFNTEIYRAQVLGEVNPKLRTEINGFLKPVFELDPDQTPEEDRLWRTIIPKGIGFNLEKNQKDK